MLIFLKAIPVCDIDDSVSHEHSEWPHIKKHLRK